MSAACSNLEEVWTERHRDRDNLQDRPTPPLSDCGSVRPQLGGGGGGQVGTGGDL